MRPLLNDMTRDNCVGGPDNHECVIRLEDNISPLSMGKLRLQVVNSLSAAGLDIRMRLIYSGFSFIFC